MSAGCLETVLVVPDRSLTLHFFYSANGAGGPFWHIPEMVTPLTVQVSDKKAPLHGALKIWSGEEFAQDPGLVGYLAEACRYLARERAVRRRDLLKFIKANDTERQLNIYMYTDDVEPRIVLTRPGNIAAGVDRPDAQLLRMSPIL